MSYHNDPQDAPLEYRTEVKRLLTVEGDEIVVWTDQDGTTWVSTADEYDTNIDGEDWL